MVGLTQEQKKQREGLLTASRIGVLMKGDPKAVYQLWMEMTGVAEEPDLSQVWPVQLGSHTEQLNLEWYALKTGHAVSRQGEVVRSNRVEWAAATLDGYDDIDKAVVECKHVGVQFNTDDIVARYYAQVQWQMMCAECPKGYLSVIFGSYEPRIIEIERNDAYIDTMVERGERFMYFVNNFIPPVDLDPVATPVAQSDMIEIDMDGNNHFASLAEQWLSTKADHDLFEETAEQLKQIMPPNCKKAYGYGITATRSKSGSISIRRKK